MKKIPISVVIVTKNARHQIEACLKPLRDFDEILVVDSHSTDGTKEKCLRVKGIEVIDYQWNGQYPKKRQWILNHVSLKNDWVLWIDADEIVTPSLICELETLFSSNFDEKGFFLDGKYVYNGKKLDYGLINSKLALFNTNYIEFPVIDDLECPGMGEIEGHYQPIFKETVPKSVKKLGKLRSYVIHDAYADPMRWKARHERYAQWEAAIDKKGIRAQLTNAETSRYRKFLKMIFTNVPAKPFIAFIHCYFLKRGFLDGAAGFGFARSRAHYYRSVLEARKRSH